MLLAALARAVLLAVMLPGAPVFSDAHVAHAGAPGRYKVDITYARIAHPVNAAQRTFEQTIAGLVYADGSWTKPQPVFGESSSYLYYDLSGTVAYASATFVSEQLFTARFDGGAHPNTFTTNVNFDLVRGHELLHAAEVLLPGALATLAQTCRKQILGDGQDWSAYAPTIADIRTTMEHLRSWSITSTGATIVFDPYAIAPYVYGSAECTLPAATLRPLLRTPTVLPIR